jgi:hypothetical protein
VGVGVFGAAGGGRYGGECRGNNQGQNIICLGTDGRAGMQGSREGEKEGHGGVREDGYREGRGREGGGGFTKHDGLLPHNTALTVTHVVDLVVNDPYNLSRTHENTHTVNDRYSMLRMARNTHEHAWDHINNQYTNAHMYN